MKNLKCVLQMLLICAVIAVAVVGCCRIFGVGHKIKLGEEPVNREVNTIPGFSMEVVGEITSRAVTVRVTNDTDTDFCSDTFFSVDAERDGVWYSVEQSREIANIGDINSYYKNSESELVCGFQRYGRLPEGHYRIVYAVFEELHVSEPHYIAAEFYIE